MVSSSSAMSPGPDISDDVSVEGPSRSSSVARRGWHVTGGHVEGYETGVFTNLFFRRSRRLEPAAVGLCRVKHIRVAPGALASRYDCIASARLVIDNDKEGYRHKYEKRGCKRKHCEQPGRVSRKRDAGNERVEKCTQPESSQRTCRGRSTVTWPVECC